MLKFYSLSFLVILLASGCIRKKTDDGGASLAVAKDSILQLTTNTAKNITAKGPIGWLDEFDNSPDFYMANDGAIALKDYSSAKKFITDTLAKHLERIKLQFSNVRVTAINGEFGSVGASFNEELTVPDDKAFSVSGYFTATAHHTDAGWKYLNMHWSIKK